MIADGPDVFLDTNKYLKNARAFYHKNDNNLYACRRVFILCFVYSQKLHGKDNKFQFLQFSLSKFV